MLLPSCCYRPTTKKRFFRDFFCVRSMWRHFCIRRKRENGGSQKNRWFFLQTCPLRFSIPAWSSNPWFLGRKCWKKLSNTCDGTPSSVLVNFVLKVCRCIIVVHTRRRDMQGNSSSSQNRYMRWDIGRHACIAHGGNNN